MLICLLGATCAGKDTILREIFNGKKSASISLSCPARTVNLNRLPIYTTRPRRNNEDDTYYFIDKDTPIQLDNGCTWDYCKNPPLEKRVYHTANDEDWEYGTLPVAINNDDGKTIDIYDIYENDYIVACSITELKNYLSKFGADYIAVIYLPVSSKIQFERYKTRLTDNNQYDFPSISEIIEMFRRIDEDSLEYRHTISWLSGIDELFYLTSIENAKTFDVVYEIFKIMEKKS